MTIKAIETHYKGYRFRSRLEARWAVFFDALHIYWQYEPQGFDLPKEGRYLPDFLLGLTIANIWAEVKPYSPSIEEIRKVARLVDLSTDDIVGGFILIGTPGDSLCPGLYIGVAPEGRGNGEVLWSYDVHFGQCPICGMFTLIYCQSNGSMTLKCVCAANGKYNAVVTPNMPDPRQTPSMRDAYEAARSARFEYGETPRVQRGKPRK